MDFKKSTALLKKINALHESASSFDGNMSAMERDLLKHYLRELYEVIVDTQPIVSSPASVTINKEMSPEQTYMPPKAQSAPPPYYEQAPMYRQNTQDAYMSESPEPRKDYGNGRYQHAVVEKEEIPQIKVDESLISLFDIDAANDLKSRFSQLPISDIGKSMGINDRILTLNELFGGDQLRFNQVVNELNRMKTFDEAKDYLIKGIARENDWASPSKSAKAEVFIKLISRRYL